MLFKLLIAHASADFALQSDAMAKGKNRHRKPDYIPAGQKFIPCWHYWLTAHALINGGMAWLVTGIVWVGFLETVLHWAIDFAKCENWTDPNQDQALHFVCKLGYCALALWVW
jgi:hypothetical protein